MRLLTTHVHGLWHAPCPGFRAHPDPCRVLLEQRAACLIETPGDGVAGHTVRDGRDPPQPAIRGPPPMPRTGRKRRCRPCCRPRLHSRDSDEAISSNRANTSLWSEVTKLQPQRLIKTYRCAAAYASPLPPRQVPIKFSTHKFSTVHVGVQVFGAEMQCPFHDRCPAKP